MPERRQPGSNRSARSSCRRLATPPENPGLVQRPRLFFIFALFPQTGLYRIPVDFVQSVHIAPVFEITGPRIGRRESPSPMFFIRPFHDIVHIRFQMNDGALTSFIPKIRVMSHMDYVEHDGSRTKIKRDTMVDTQFGVTTQEVFTSPGLDPGDADHRSGATARRHRRVA